VQGAGLVTVFQPVAINIPTLLSATPRVNGDGTITMFIPFTLSQQTGESVGPNGERIPNSFTSQIAVLRRVPNGGTVVLGGTLTKSDSESTNRIPILSELPIIGRLFRSKLLSKNDTETLIFFTPTIIPDLPSGPGIQ
jgi:type II secretory pathway component GspD/PulD (secretin)